MKKGDLYQVRMREDGALWNPTLNAGAGGWVSYSRDHWAQCAMPVKESPVANPEAPTKPPPNKPKPEEKETPEDIERRSRKPPADGPCKGCGKNKPLNRLMLCFKCWVNKNLLDWSKANKKDWIPGDPHPDWCKCGLPEHGSRTDGN